MARIINDQLLFIHVAKTGGTFVREALNRFGIPNWETGVFEIEDHYSYEDVILNHPELSRLISFGFKREPVSWIQSRWLWAMETNLLAKIKYNDEAKEHWMADIMCDDVNQFARGIIEKHPGICKQYFDRMLHGVDYIFNYETIYQDLSSMLTICDRKISAEQLMHLPKFKHVRNQYSYQINADIAAQIRAQNC